MKICRCMALLLVCASCSDRDARGVRVTTAMAASVPGSGAEPVDVDPASLTPPAALRVEEFAIPNAIGACAAASPYPHDPATASVVAQLPLPSSSPGPVRNMAVDIARQRVWLALSDVGRLAVIQF